MIVIVAVVTIMDVFINMKVMHLEDEFYFKDLADHTNGHWID